MTVRLLLPLDGSQVSEVALPWAIYLARRRHATVVLAQALHVLPVVAGGPMGELGSAEMYDDIIVAEREAADAYLHEVRQRLVAEGLAVETFVQVASAAAMILDLADHLGVELIVMATHGRGGLSRLVLGSVAEQVLQQATVPILLVRADERAAERAPALDRLLVPLDGSMLAERAIGVAAQLADRGTRIVLMRAVEPPRAASARARTWNTVVDRDGQRAAHEYLERTGSALAQTGLRVRTDVRAGTPAEQILLAAHEHDADLVVMVTHGRTGPARWLLGSVADAVVRCLDRPVLLVSARALIARTSEPYTVGDVMSRQVSYVRTDDTLATALRKLLRARVGGLPVLDAQDHLVGMISAQDLVDWHGNAVAKLTRQGGAEPGEYASQLRSVTVDRVMQKPAAYLDESAPLGQAVKLFRERAVGRVPVMRGGQLVGIVTSTDILKAMAARDQEANGTDEALNASD